MMKSTSGINTVAGSLRSEVNGAVSQLVGVYKAHLQAADKVLSASSNAVISQASGA